jgi:hypothetical protein
MDCKIRLFMLDMKISFETEFSLKSWNRWCEPGIFIWITGNLMSWVLYLLQIFSAAEGQCKLCNVDSHQKFKSEISTDCKIRLFMSDILVSFEAEFSLKSRNRWCEPGIFICITGNVMNWFYTYYKFSPYLKANACFVMLIPTKIYLWNFNGL